MLSKQRHSLTPKLMRIYSSFMASTNKPLSDLLTQVPIQLPQIHFNNFLNTRSLFLILSIDFISSGRPGIFNMRDRAKWDAWKAVEGTYTDIIYSYASILTFTSGTFETFYNLL